MAPSPVGWTNNTIQTYVDFGENFVASFVCLFVASIGLCVNATVGIFVLRLRVLTTQFALLSASLAAADSGVLACFLFWAFPMTFSQSQLATSVIGRKIGQISLFFWFAGLYATFAIAVNRYFAICQPLDYKSWFSTHNTLRVIVICWSSAIFHSFLYFLPGCSFYFDPESYVWRYSQSECTLIAWYVVDFGYSVLFFLIIFVVNVATLLRIRQINQEFKILPPSSTTRQQRSAQRRHEREIRFFVQACINAVVFELMLISFHVFSKFSSGKWHLFMTTSVAWMISHSTNGFVLLIFNDELRRGIVVTCCCLDHLAPVRRTNLATDDPRSLMSQLENDQHQALTISTVDRSERPRAASHQLMLSPVLSRL